jgi:hypothetical protein
MGKTVSRILGAGADIIALSLPALFECFHLVAKFRLISIAIDEYRDMVVGRQRADIPRPCKPANRASLGSNRSTRCSHLSHIRVNHHLYINSDEIAETHLRSLY